MENRQILPLATQIQVPKESDEGRKLTQEKIYEIFSCFMTRITKLDELVNAASSFLTGFQQAIGFLKRPTSEMNHVVVQHLLKANTTRWLSSYIEAGCSNSHDIKQNMIKSRSMVEELASLLDDARETVQAAFQNMHPLEDNDVDSDLNSCLSPFSEEKVPSSVLREPEVTDYANLMAFVYWMVKKDYQMQETVVSDLSLKTSSEELQSYCLMWSLRPFVDDEIIERAWSFIR